MLRGLYTAASGMITEQARTDTIANNLANVNTSGYKRDVAVNEEFSAMLLRRINDDNAQDDGKMPNLQNVDAARNYFVPGIDGSAPTVGELGRGSRIAEIAVDREQGALENTGNNLDLAITGDGYFLINTSQGIRYTRDGNFYRSAAGQLVTANNQAVLGINGRPINIPPDAVEINIGADGTVDANGQNVGRIQLASFADRRALLKEGNNLYRPQNGAQPQQATGSIQQGFLERSNVNVAKEMVELITNYRTYEADSKALTTQDSLLDKAVNDVGRVS